MSTVLAAMEAFAKLLREEQLEAAAANQRLQMAHQRDQMEFHEQTREKLQEELREERDRRKKDKEDQERAKKMAMAKEERKKRAMARYIPPPGPALQRMRLAASTLKADTDVKTQEANHGNGDSDKSKFNSMFPPDPRFPACTNKAVSYTHLTLPTICSV